MKTELHYLPSHPMREDTRNNEDDTMRIHTHRGMQFTNNNTPKNLCISQIGLSERNTITIRATKAQFLVESS